MIAKRSALKWNANQTVKYQQMGEGHTIITASVSSVLNRLGMF